MDEPETTAVPRRRKRVRTVALLVIALIVSWYGVVRLVSPWTMIKSITLDQENAVSADDAVKVLRVGCYNIAHGRGGRFGARNWHGGSRADKIERLKKIARLLKDARLDIVVLNEVDFSSVWSGHVDQARVIAEEGGYSYLIEQRNVDVGIPFCRVRYGNAILSRYPLSEVRLLDYPNVSWVVEVVVGGVKEGIVCTAELPDGSRLRVVGVHLSASSESRRVASARMICDVHRESNVPLIAIGDFNSTPQGYPEFGTDEAGDNAIEIMFADKELMTLPVGLPVDPKDFTFPSESPDRVIDWVFVSSPWRLTKKQVLSSDLSDHFPVIAQLDRVGDD